MNNKLLAKKFAAGATSGTGSNLFIDGNTIYSYGYHFAVAKRTGDATANITTRRYSQSTARHVSLVRSALSSAGFILTETDSVNA